ncbi:MAG: lamin tail domain-containing protein [Bacteroidota bacterium]
MRLFFTLFCCACLVTGFAQTNHDVAVSSNVYTPDMLTIQVGDMVTWTNMGGFHNVNGEQATYPANPESFGNGAASGAAWTYSYTFNTPGTYTYQCDPHVGFNMIGTVIVEAATGGGSQNVIITEINYNPPESGTDSLEYVELYNAGPGAADMTGWTFDQGFDFTFPSYTLAEGAYLIMAVNESAFRNNYSYTGDVFQWDEGALSNGGEDIVIITADGTQVDIVDFTDDAPWPTSLQGTDGGGASIVLCDFMADNNVGANWQAATTPTGVTINGNELLGNPGAVSDCGDVAPSVFFSQTGDSVQEGDAPRTYSFVAQNYPAGVEITLAFVVMEPTVNTADVSTNPVLPATYVTTGETSETFTFELTIIDDADIESDENFVVTLVPSSGEFLGDNLSIVVRDNDTEIVVVAIDDINDVDENGDAISDGETATVQGVVHCGDFRGGEGYQFWIIETDTGDGINIFSFDDVDDYEVTEGDLLQITGEIDQFNGLLEIVPTDIEVLSQGNMLVEPTVVTALNEETESKYVTLEQYTPIGLGTEDMIMRAGGGFNVLMLSFQEADTITIRVEDEVGVDSVFLADYFNGAGTVADYSITGIASQRDQSDPLLGDYQLLPCGEGSFEYIVSTNEPTWAADLMIFPNPTASQLNIWAGVDLEAYQLVDMQGRILQMGRVNTPSLTIDMEVLPRGLYQLQLIRAGEVVNRAVVKQ